MPFDTWFSNCGRGGAKHDLHVLGDGIGRGLLNTRDEYGATALMLAAWSGWDEGVRELLRAGADTEIRYLRTGATAVYELAVRKAEAMGRLLTAAGANPDAPNYWGIAPRRIHPELFRDVPVRLPEMPDPVIQNAEHLAEHYHPRFEIRTLKERIALRPGQAVDLYVYGPKGGMKQDAFQVRITACTGEGRAVRYTANVEATVEETHLRAETKAVTFGPENVATVYVPRPARRS